MLSIELDQNWQFSQAGLNVWSDARVPGTVHTDLLRNGIIDDPFYRTNEKDLQWIDKVDWSYRTHFEVDSSLLEHDVVELCIHGLDTYAFVFLNGHIILKANNMFRVWSVNVKRHLDIGNNELQVYFRSPVKQGLSEQKYFGMRLPAVNDQSENGGLGPNKVSVFSRKAGFHYGWDWGPRFVTSGIWRPIELLAWNQIKIKDVFIAQEKIDTINAQLKAIVSVENPEPWNVKVVVENVTDNSTIESKELQLSPELPQVEIPFSIENPRLWWSNGLGESFLYHFRVKIISENGSEVEKEIRTGLRSLNLVRERDEFGESFYFELNGQKVFAKGANYIPNDIFLTEVKADDYRKVISDAASANMNMIRVWGGGIYEEDIFYDLCDEMGIMVWQDFMFACSLYPGDQEFLDNIKQEAIDNVVRLRNHPSIALWCGNNEINTMWGFHGDEDPLGWKKLYSSKQKEFVNDAYLKIFHEILPEVIENYTDGDDYWPSSPQAGYKPEKHSTFDTLSSGDQHYWGVWHGLHPFSAFEKYVGRFMSEYGFQSFPEFETVKKYTIPSDHDIESEVMAAHQRSGFGNLRIKEYMEREYNVPENFEQFLYLSQVLQAEGIRMAVEAHRRNMPRCMGSLYWQLNDCWPVASWASIDYYHNWKALHYAVRKAFEPVILSVYEGGSLLKVFSVSDRVNDFIGTLLVKVLSFSGKVIRQLELPVQVEASSSKILFSTDLEALLKGAEKDQVVIHCSLYEEGKVLFNALHYLLPPKELKLHDRPKIKLKLSDTEQGLCLKVSSPKLVKNLMLFIPDLQILFSDNYFDLLPGEEKEVWFHTSLKANDLNGKIKFRHVVVG
ncbi:beta-mannosidase [Marinilabilia rubra]|uniref:Beta-mannosidase B n=1 Tax=Marinilabilia rubra TaxID=2162893 RepID=A0A2U2B8I7_9BACT|nr:glycoside hydrolase family 2 protein [Marinilabilia rubra]PWD99379.1 beta-mannosidase [Marinilabilia rubra]